jgi:purine-nucleoside phosphorylase
MRGRFHLYEGYDWATVTLPARVMAAWGVPNLFLTNAAGGLNKSFRVGDLMLLTAFRDQLSPILKETGLIPALIDPPTSTQNELSDLIVKVNAALAKKSKTYRSIQEGTYAGLLGPSYETHAEIEMLRRLGSDAVGMSTVPELKAVIGTATQAAAISVITNVWSEDVALEGHKEVLKAAKEASKRLDTLLTEVIAKA